MTFRRLAEQYLYERGMFADQAAAVVDQMAAKDDPMHGRWDDDIEGYPEGLQSVLLMQVDSEALKWIDANVPEAWYRSLFEAKAAV